MDISFMDDYVVVNGKKFRKGYTTGSCAAAASKAAVSMLLTGKTLDTIGIDTPAGIRLNLPVTEVEFYGDSIKCAVLKDGGDDPDMTTGLKVFAEVKPSPEAGIEIKTGIGIGIVTLKGLKVEVGKPAINPVPMQMIMKELHEVLPEGMGVEILLSVPGGEEVAKRTYNPKLGIVGGISILGTTGIVEPMSEEAWKESLALELNILAAKNHKSVVYTFGNYGDNFASEKLNIDANQIVNMSNFVGYMLERAMEKGFEEILIIGHLGKLVKVAAGIFQTHSKVADARMEIMSSYAAREGGSTDLVRRIFACKTTEAAAEIVDQNHLSGVYDRIAANVSRRCGDYTFNKIRFGTVLFNGADRILAMDAAAKEMLAEFERQGK